MRPCLSWMLAMLLSVVFVPQVVAQEGEEEGGGSASEEGTGGEADPWEAPPAGETEKTEEAPAEPEVVIPSGYPVAEIDRPLTLPRMTLEPRLSFTVDIIDPDNWVGIRLGSGFGVIDDLEIGLEFPLSFSPEFYAGDFRLYGMYELGPFMSSKLFTALKLQMIIPFSDHYLFWGMVNFGIMVDGMVKYKLHEMFALIADLGMGILITEDPTYFWLMLEAGVLVQPIEPLALSMTFGAGGLLGDNNEEIIPLKFRGQYTIVGDLDVFMEVAFVDLSEGADWVQLLFGAAYRIGL